MLCNSSPVCLGLFLLEKQNSNQHFINPVSYLKIVCPLLPGTFGFKSTSILIEVGEKCLSFFKPRLHLLIPRLLTPHRSPWLHPHLLAAPVLLERWVVINPGQEAEPLKALLSDVFSIFCPFLSLNSFFPYSSHSSILIETEDKN